MSHLPTRRAAGHPRAVRTATVALLGIAASLAPSLFTSADALTPPPVQTPTIKVYDHVDFGDPASEKAHGMEAAPWGSQAGREAGLTRRTLTVPGSLTVTLSAPDQTFVLRDLETFAGPGTREFDIYVNGEWYAHERLVRTVSGPGTQAYSEVVETPGTVMMNGSPVAVVSLRYGVGSPAGPSSADLWAQSRGG